MIPTVLNLVKCFFLLALFLTACTARVPVEEPTIRSVPAALISHEGASFYVLEGPDDFLDDGGDKFLNPRIPREESDYEFDRGRIPESKGALWMGEQGLDLVLRYGLSRRQVRLIGHADFQPTSGNPTEVTLFNTDPEPPPPGGDPSIRTAFRIRLKATTGKNPNLVALEWETDKLTDGPAPEEGARAGQFPRTATRIHVGSGVLPRFATLLWFHPEESHRGHYLLLRISSLRDP